MHADGSELTATGRIIKAGRRIAVAEAQVHNGTAALIATATTSCLTFSGP